MAAIDDAIEATGRQVRTVATITWPGGNPVFDNLVTDITFNQSISDLPDSVTQIAGTAGASATVKLDQAKVLPGGVRVDAHDLSPFSSSSSSVKSSSAYGLRAPIIVSEQIFVPATQTWVSTPIFTGYVTEYSLGDDSSVTLQCQDKSAARAAPQLPTIAGNGANAPSTMSVVDACLRSMGHCITPPARTVFPLVSIPNLGGALPDVGSVVGTGNNVTAAAPPPVLASSLPATILMDRGALPVRMAAAPGSVGIGLFVDGWVRLAPTGIADTSIVWQVGGAALTVRFTPNSGNTASQLRIVWGGGATIDVPTTLVPCDGQWHYLGIATYSGTTYVNCDGTTQSFAGGEAWYSITVGTTVVLNALTVGFQASAPGAGYAFTPTWTPAPTQLEANRRFSAMPKIEGSAWQIIQELAAAYGDIARFDGAGKFIFETRETWKAKRFGTPTRTLTSDRVLSGAPSWNDTGVRSSAAATSVAQVLKQSTAAAPAWVATETYTVPGLTTRVININLDYTIIAPLPFTGGFQTDANSSWQYAVRQAGADGDPAQQGRVAIAITVDATPTGIAITVVNRYAFPIALWSPGNGGTIDAGPYLVVHGTTIRTAAPVTSTAGTGVDWAEALTLGDSGWRQDATLTKAWVDDIAPELSVPQIQWPGITIPFDPRIQLGSVIALRDTRYMDVTHPVQVVGIAGNLPANGSLHSMTLTVRSCYPPTGWVLGVPGRSELGTTTLLIV